MAQTGVESFERTLHETNVWIKDVGELLESGDRQRNYRVLKGVLQALRDRLTVDEAVQIGAQFPMLVRGFYYEGWRPSEVPVRIRSKEEFLDRVRDNLHDIVADPEDPLDVEQATQAVFRVLTRHVSPGEIDDVRHQLPGEVRRICRRRPRLEASVAAAI